MEESRAGADYQVVPLSRAIGDSQARIYSPLLVQNTVRPTLPVGANAEIHGQMTGRAPVVLSKKTAVSVIEDAERIVTDRLRVVAELKY